MIPEAATNDHDPLGPDVLIVEDEKISRKALSMLLEAYGYKPAAYESAEQALRYLVEHPLPLVLLVDVDLPGMSGLELIQQLKQVHPAARAVLLTAAEGERIARFRREHSNNVDYLRKPVNFERLLQMIQRLSRKHHRPN